MPAKYTARGFEIGLEAFPAGSIEQDTECTRDRVSIRCLLQLSVPFCVFLQGTSNVQLFTVSFAVLFLGNTAAPMAVEV